MTIIEMDTMHAIQNACREITNKSKKIDWEQRRYEIAKSVIGHCEDITAEDLAKRAVAIADALIVELKK